MTTDTAVLACHKILTERMPLNQLAFCDCPTIRFSQSEAVELPYRYLAAKDDAATPLLAPGMFEKLKRDNEADVFNLNME
jgi:ribosome biogenesis SPOUT family RNA methylase Rps3